jgi:hypothetical protein
MLWFSHAPRNAAAHFGVAPTQLSNEMKLEAGHIPCHLPCGDGAVSRIGDNTTVGFSSRTSGARSTWRECAECCVSVLSRKHAGEPGPSLCRKNGSDLPIGHIKGYRLASKNRALFLGVRARKQVCGLLLEVQVSQHDCIITNGASATARESRCS